MNVQKYLEKVKVLDEKVQDMIERYEELKENATNAGAIRYDKEQVQSSISGSKLEEVVIAYMKLEADIPVMQARFDEQRNNAIRMIQMLDDKDDQDILMLKYIHYLSFNQIARSYDVTRRTAINWNNNCLRELKMKIQA